MPHIAPERDAGTSQWRRYLAAVVCSFGGMAFGYDLGALSAATQGLMRVYTLSPALFGLTASASLWGAMCASPIAGRLADQLGRRRLLAACSCLYALAVGALAMPAHWPLSVVVALRLGAGLATGGFVVGCPLYLAEIAPRRLRGRFVGWFQLQIGAGMASALAISAAAASRMSEIAEWKLCFGLGAVPPGCLLLLLHWMPEEPGWLAREDRWKEAAEAAERLGIPQSEWPVRDGNTAERTFSAPKERLFRRCYLRPLLLAASVALFNQLCGVTVLRVYLLDLLASAGMGRLLSHRYGVILAALNLVALLLGALIVDKVGRKPLLIVGSAGMALCLFLFAWGLRNHGAVLFHLGVLIAYNTFFACSQGAAAWVFLSEIFPFPVRGKGQGFGALVHWIANASLIWIFPVMEHAAPQSCFLIFASLMILQILVVHIWYPETKGTRLGAVPLVPVGGAIAEHGGENS